MSFSNCTCSFDVCPSFKVSNCTLPQHRCRQLQSIADSLKAVISLKRINCTAIPFALTSFRLTGLNREIAKLALQTSQELRSDPLRRYLQIYGHCPDRSDVPCRCSSLPLICSLGIKSKVPPSSSAAMPNRSAHAQFLHFQLEAGFGCPLIKSMQRGFTGFSQY